MQAAPVSVRGTALALTELGERASLAPGRLATLAWGLVLAVATGRPYRMGLVSGVDVGRTTVFLTTRLTTFLGGCCSSTMRRVFHSACCLRRCSHVAIRLSSALIATLSETRPARSSYL